MVLLMLGFVLLAAVIAVSGDRMTEEADEIAGKTGISRGFIGFMLLAAATSLPELVTSVAAAAWLGSAGLAFGNVFGSNVFNLLIVFLMDLVHVEGRVLGRLRIEDTAEAIWNIVITAVVALGVVLGMLKSDLASLGRLSVVTLPLFILYGISLHSAYGRARIEDREGGGAPGPVLEKGPGEESRWLGQHFRRFGIAVALVVVSGVALTWICDRIARVTGMGETFVGVLLLALATSLPEVTVSVAAVRRGHIDMGLGNIVGSGVFNLAILGVCDVVSWQGSPFLTTGARESLPAAFVSIAMIGILLLGMLDPAWKRAGIGRFSLASLVLLGLYLLSNGLTWLVSH